MLYHFKSCVLDLVRGCLRVDGQEATLRPKSFEALRYLVENSGRLIPKDELIKVLWPDTTVTDESLTNCIAEVRRAIGDRDQTIVKTVPRRGYIFAAEVTAQDPADGRVGPGAAAAEPAQPDKPSIAVLAFTNMSGDPSQEYFSDGITEDIITELSRFSALFVIARNSSFQYKGKAVDVRQVGCELGVRYVLEGSVRRSGRRVRISAQLVDAVSGAHRWAERYDRQLEDAFALQDEVARAIAPILAAHVNKAEIERALNKPPVAWQAYDYYLRATHIQASYFSSFRAADLYEIRRLLEQSLALDPDYARACTMLSWTHFSAWIAALDGDHLNPAAFNRAYQQARKAVQLDPNLPEAQAMLGHVLGRRGEHDAAIAAFERALALNPNFTDWRFPLNLVCAGEPERAIAAMKRHMRLDPFYAPLAPMWLGAAQYMLKAYAQAVPPLQECVSRAPDVRGGHLWLAATYAQLGRLDEARAEAAEVLRIEPTWSNEGVGARIYDFRRIEDARHFLDGLRKAGLPD